MHSHGLFHFDLKLENIMINEPLELENVNSWIKVVDFGCVTSVVKQKEGYTNYAIGTEEYNAPEIQYRKPYKGEPVDVFALGFILFAMVFGRYPFTHATLENNNYKGLINKTDEFWG